jgi:uncharacterized protein (DUF2267 family)
VHPPDDARALCQARLRQWTPPADVDTVDDFVLAVAPFGRTASPEEVVKTITAVLSELRALVPEEAGDIAAVLPEGLRHLWEGAE